MATQKDWDNTKGGGNDTDGDLSRTADATYTHAVRAIAGLLYLFGHETGQLRFQAHRPRRLPILLQSNILSSFS